LFTCGNKKIIGNMVDMIRRFSYTRVRVEKFTRNRISNFSKTGHVLQQGSQETAILARPRIRSLQSSAMTFRRARFSVLITSLLCALITLAALPHSAEARYASIVMDSRTGEVLYSRNADDLLYPASLTKIMTLYMTFDALERGKLRLGQKLPVSARAAGQAPTKLGLRKGESISVQDAMFGLITKSANDAATVLAEAMAQSEMEFARMMTAKARSLGMNRTTFRNASGLPNRHQKSTARDMAILGAAMIQDFPQYYHFLSLQEFDYKGTAYKNHNNLLGKYNGADGIKTGYIRASGFNLVASAKRGNNRLIGVVFGGRTAKTRDTHMASLLDRGFERIEATYPSTVPTPFDKPLRIALGTPHDTDTEIEVAATTQVPLPVQSQPSSDASRIYRISDVNTVGVSITRGSTPADDNSGFEMDKAANARWAIQIGAYSHKTTAQDQINKAAAQSSGILEGRRINIEKAISDGKPFYRAQVIGFDETEARKACSNLAAQRVSCFVVAPDLRLPSYIAQKNNS